MWAASIVMMVCSWLSYVDRQILATLSVVDPGRHRIEHRTVHRSGLRVLHRLYDRESAVGLAAGLRRIAQGNAGGGGDLERGEPVALVRGAGHGGVSRTGRGPRAAGIRRRRDVSPGDSARPWIPCPRIARRAGIAISYSGGSLGAIVTPFLVIPIAGRFWMAGGIPGDGRAGIRVAGAVGQSRAAAVSAGCRNANRRRSFGRIFWSGASGRWCAAIRWARSRWDRSCI